MVFISTTHTTSATVVVVKNLEEFYNTRYSIRRTGVPSTSSHSFGRVFLTFSVTLVHHTLTPLSRSSASQISL
jgi:hypothetical protein